MPIRVRGKSVVSGVGSNRAYFARWGVSRLMASRIPIHSGTDRASPHWSGLKRKIATWSLVCAGLLVSACGNEMPSYRYKLTVEVETPEGLRTGSGVIEVRTFRSSDFPGATAGGVNSRIRAEAVAVDLGAQGTLFVLLSGRDSPTQIGSLAMAALMPRRVDQRGTAEALENNIVALKRISGAALVPPESYPTLVRFGDVRNPTSVVEVSAANLSASFGPGVRLRRMMAEITDEDVTTGIESRLPWLSDSPERRLDSAYRGGTNPSLPQRLSHGDFLRGD